MNVSILTGFYLLFLMAIIGGQIYLSLRKKALWGLIMPLLLVVPIAYYSYKFLIIYPYNDKIFEAGEGYAIAIARQRGSWQFSIVLFVIFIMIYIFCMLIKKSNFKCLLCRRMD
jgi:hypothetical protein